MVFCINVESNLRVFGFCKMSKNIFYSAEYLQRKIKNKLSTLIKKHKNNIVNNVCLVDKQKLLCEHLFIAQYFFYMNSNFFKDNILYIIFISTIFVFFLTFFFCGQQFGRFLLFLKITKNIFYSAKYLQCKIKILCYLKNVKVLQKF